VSVIALALSDGRLGSRLGSSAASTTNTSHLPRRIVRLLVLSLLLIFMRVPLFLPPDRSIRAHIVVS